MINHFNLQFLFNNVNRCDNKIFSTFYLTINISIFFLMLQRPAVDFALKISVSVPRKMTALYKRWYPQQKREDLVIIAFRQGWTTNFLETSSEPYRKLFRETVTHNDGFFFFLVFLVVSGRKPTIQNCSISRRCLKKNLRSHRVIFM